METTSYPKEIQVFFDEIVVKINEVLDADFILIAGSFGKESWLYLNNELISDFEFVFVCSKLWSLKKKSQLLKKLNSEYPYEINLKGFLSKKVENKVISNYALKNPGYLSLDFFDTFSNPIFLYNKNDDILDIDCEAYEIPVWEAWRLYVNRMADLLKIDCSKNSDSKIVDYYWLKIFESTAGAYCIVNEIYHKNISKRLAIFNKELIEQDEELNETCKNSFPIIKQALLARDEHDLIFFKNSLSVNERKKIIISWMDYFERKLSFQENLRIESDDFGNRYLKNKLLQKKYLGFNYKFNIIVSNLIRFINNPKLLNLKFKFYNNKFSWRHIVLLCISSTFKEQYLGIQNFPKSKKIITKIVSKKSLDNLNNENFINTVLYYWKILR